MVHKYNPAKIWHEMLSKSFSSRQWFMVYHDEENISQTEGKTMYVYMQTAEGYEVGFFRPDTHEWVAVGKTFKTEKEAAQHVHWLHGGNFPNG